MDRKLSNKARIAQYLYTQEHASKVDIVNTLGISLPTVLQNSKELIQEGIVLQGKTYESTGGRKATSLQLNGKKKVSIGIDITANHIVIVLLDLTGNRMCSDRKRRVFSNSLDYYNLLVQEINEFLILHKINSKQVLGVGISFPGIIDNDAKIIIKSHALLLDNVNLKILEQLLPYPVYFENDANAAAMAEKNPNANSVVYLSLSNTVGGSICIDGRIFRGSNYKAGEFGHMTLVPNGKICYCGKKGCVDAYCSSLVLAKNYDGNLELFMQKLEANDAQALQDWDMYLEYLAITIVNLRMAYDIDIVLGGYVGSYLPAHLLTLSKKIIALNTFETDITYIKSTTYGKESAAIGVAKYFIEEYIHSL